MNKEEELFQKRLTELADQAYNRNKCIFTDFMNLHELHIFHMTMHKCSYAKWELFGGYETAERQMAVFLPEALYYSPDFPVACLKITPLQEKFSRPLGHRDFLGAILNLGIDRSKLGDILLDGNTAYLFCYEKMMDFIASELTRVKHTSVLAQPVNFRELGLKPKTEEVLGTVSSVRLDRLIALAFSASRSKMVPYIEGGKVFANGKLITSNAYTPDEGEIISVRGMGRFRFCSVGGKTKKGRLYVTLEKYVS